MNLEKSKPEVRWFNSTELEDGAKELVELALRHRTNYLGGTLADIKEEMTSGQLRIWHMSDDGLDCWFMTRCASTKHASELQIVGIYGTGIFKHAKAILKEWQDMARYLGCDFIWTQTSDKRVARILAANKFQEMTRTFLHVIPPEGKAN